MRVLTLIFVILINWSLCLHHTHQNVTIQSMFRRPLLSRVLAPGPRLQNLNTDTSRIRHRSSPQHMHSIQRYNGAAASRAYRTSQNTNTMYIDKSQGVKTIRYSIPGIRTIYNTRYISPGSKNITIYKNITFHRVGPNSNVNNKNITINRIGPNVNINKSITFHRVGQNIDNNAVIRSPVQVRQNVTYFPSRVPLNTGQITNCLRCRCISGSIVINIRCQACCYTSQQTVVKQLVHHHRCTTCGETHAQSNRHRFIHQYKIHHPPNYRICKYYRRVMNHHRTRRSSVIRRIWSSKCLPRH